MQKVTVKYTSGKERTYSGVIGFQAGNEAFDIQFYDQTAMLVPFSRIDYVKRKALSDEDILNGTNKKFAAWYKEQMEAAQKRMDAEKEMAEAAAKVEEDQDEGTDA